jgi:adenosylmethionine-8-amino-7-oxononanoate aminotransferase
MLAGDWAGTTRGKQEQPFRPDLLCLSKGLTGGTLPLAATLATQEIFDAFYAEYESGKAFLHSHSYTGNPLACSAALATLEVFAQRDWMAHTRGLGHLMWMAVSPLLNHPHVAEVRQQGMIVAIELAQNVRQRQPYPRAERRGLRVYRHGLEHGVLLRPLGDVIYFMPPYVIEPEEIGLMARVAIDGIERATA